MDNENLEIMEGESKRQRWKPVKEQISYLMELYNHGLRRPSPGQVAKIASRLRHYGMVKDSSVYYWFQNYGFRRRWRAEKKLAESSSIPPLPVFSSAGVSVNPVVHAPTFQILNLFPLTPVSSEREIAHPVFHLAPDPSTELSLRVPSLE